MPIMTIHDRVHVVCAEVDTKREHCSAVAEYLRARRRGERSHVVGVHRVGREQVVHPRRAGVGRRCRPSVENIPQRLNLSSHAVKKAAKWDMKIS